MTSKYLRDVGRVGDPISHASLLPLSGLSAGRMAEFKSEWSSVDSARKCEILARLSEMGEDNLELDFTAVLQACLGDADEAVREQAARGLWECEDRAIIAPLSSLVTTDPSPSVRAAAATVLGTFAEMAQAGRLIDRDSERVFEALFSAVSSSDEETDVRRRALESIAHFDDPAIEDVIEETYYEGSSELKQSAIFAMGRTSNSQWLSTVLDDIEDESPAVRFEAASACGLLGDESTVSHLLALIDDEDFQVQNAAVEALGSIGGPTAKQALLECTTAEDEALQEAAHAALRAIEFDEDPLGFRFDP